MVLTTALTWALALAVTAWTVARALAHPGSGRDLAPLYAAAVAARSSEPVYAVPGFVYPPVAAYAAVPLTLLPLRAAVVVTTAAGAAALVAACALTTGALAPLRLRRWVPALSALAVGALFAATPTARSLRLDTASLLLPLVVVVTARAWARGREGTGTALLTASLLVKPVLLPLALVPLVRGRVRPLLVWGSAGVAVLAVSLVPVVAGAGTGGLTDAVHSLLAANYFRGREAPQNTSLAGLGRVHSLPGAVVLTLRAAAAALGAAVLVAEAVHTRVRAGRPPQRPGAAGAGPGDVARLLALGTAGTAALLLAGSISEVHYALVLLPGVAAVACSRRPVPAVLAAGAAAAFLAATRNGYAASTQLLLVACEALALLSCAALLLPGRGARPG